MQEREDIRILDTVIRNFPSNLTVRNPPLSQQWSLVFGKVLIQQVHAAASDGVLPVG